MSENKFELSFEELKEGDVVQLPFKEGTWLVLKQTKSIQRMGTFICTKLIQLNEKLEYDSSNPIHCLRYDNHDEISPENTWKHKVKLLPQKMVKTYILKGD